MCGDGVGVTFYVGRRGVLIGWWWMWEVLASLVHHPIVKVAARRGKGLWAEEWGINRGIFSIWQVCLGDLATVIETKENAV